MYYFILFSYMNTFCMRSRGRIRHYPQIHNIGTGLYVRKSGSILKAKLIDDI